MKKLWVFLTVLLFYAAPLHAAFTRDLTGINAKRDGNFTRNLTVGGTLNVTGAVDLDSSLTISSLTVANSATIGSTMTVSSVSISGRAVFGNLNSRHMFWDATNKELRSGDGVQTNNRAGDGQFVANLSGGNPKMRVGAWGTSQQGFWACDRARGTQASSSTLASGDTFCSLLGNGYDGITTAHSPELVLYSTGAWSATNHGGFFIFKTIDYGGTGQEDTLRVGWNGVNDVGVPNGSLVVGADVVPGSKLHVQGATAYLVRLVNSNASETAVLGVNTANKFQLADAAGTDYHYFGVASGVPSNLQQQGGNLGVNVAAPRTKLEVAGGVYASSSFTAAAYWTIGASTPSLAFSSAPIAFLVAASSGLTSGTTIQWGFNESAISVSTICVTINDYGVNTSAATTIYCGTSASNAATFVLPAGSTKGLKYCGGPSSPVPILVNTPPAIWVEGTGLPAQANIACGYRTQ